MSKVFDLVLGVFREPGVLVDLRDTELPESLSLVIRLAAGEGAALQCALDTTGETPETLVDASVFFLQQVLFAPGADSYRVLGADSDAPPERLRDNYRWLMKWLHPDRNQDGWEAVYADRVNVAWQDLKTPDRRARYDRRSPSTKMLAPMSAASMRRAVPVVPIPSGPLLSGSTVRRLPTLVLGTLGLASMALIGITYWAQSTTERELSALRRDRDSSADTFSARPGLDPREKASAVDAEAATSAATAAVRADLAAIDVVFADVAPTAPAAQPPAKEAAVAGVPVDVPVISATPVGTLAETEVVIAAEPAPVAMVAEPAAVSIQQLTADPTAAPEAAIPEHTPGTVDLPATTGQGADIALAQPVVAANLTPAASAPTTPLPNAVEPSSDSLERATMPVQVVAVPAIARGPLPEPPPAPAPKSVVKPAVVAAAPAQGPADAPKPSTVLAVHPPQPAARRPHPTPRDMQISPPVATAKVAASPAEPSPAAPTAPPGPRASPNSTAVDTAEVAAPSASILLAVAPPPLPAPEQHDAEALVQEFASAYAAGDLARFDRLFTRTSPEVAAVIQMRSRFGSTEMRYLQIEQIGWHAEAEQGRVRARYRDTYVPRGRRKAVIESGVIEWIIRVDSGDARIASVARNNVGS